MKHTAIAQTLSAITKEMQHLGLWHDASPSQEKLASKLPFCVDTLTFCEWLQWIMFPKLFVIIETKANLPSKSNMSVMAQEALKREDANTEQLLKLITQLDKDIVSD
jgi:uncharacterized protein YqcC (DUF446 family)